MSERPANPPGAGTVRLADLPAGLVVIAETIGLDATLRLAEARGAIEYYYPRPEFLSADHPLVALLGWSAATALCELIGGSSQTLPSARGALRAARDREIRAARRHSTLRTLAHRYNLSERRILEIQAAGDAGPEAAGQMRLL